jgi:hypothetical protein
MDKKMIVECPYCGGMFESHVILHCHEGYPTVNTYDWLNIDFSNFETRINDEYQEVLLFGNWIPIHKLVMTLKMGRPLRPGEIVHHRDGNKLNNALDNLSISDNSVHKSVHQKMPFLGAPCVQIKIFYLDGKIGTLELDDWVENFAGNKKDVVQAKNRVLKRLKDSDSAYVSDLLMRFFNQSTIKRILATRIVGER